MLIYWVNEYHYGDEDDYEASIGSVAFYATRELAQSQADQIIERQRQQWEERTKRAAGQRELNEKAISILKANNIEISLPYAYGPSEFEHHVAVEEIDVWS